MGAHAVGHPGSLWLGLGGVWFLGFGVRGLEVRV